MEQFRELEKQIQLRLFFGLAAIVTICLGLFALGLLLDIGVLPAALLALALGSLLSVFAASLIASSVLEPIETVQRAVLHVDPTHQGTPAPNLDTLKIGRALVTDLVLQVYRFASQENSKDLIAHRKNIIQATNVIDHLPLPLFVCNKELLTTSTSAIAREYCKLESAELLGKPLFDLLHLEFSSKRTLEAWMINCQQNKITDTATWERVHVLSRETNELIKQCDIVAYYDKDNTSGAEFIVALYDRSAQYGKDDDSLSFVALAVHELRTPLTMLRGYIEIFEEELEGKLNPEMASFMLKLDTSAKRLSGFVSNILNVVRIDQNQLTLHLTEANWTDTLKATMVDLEQRAALQNITIEYNLAPDLPSVGIDKTTIAEVITNLIENAIKYGGKTDTKRIIVATTMGKTGLVETTIQDFGVGIPASVLQGLFEKFSRNHRTRDTVSGTGLGLYLCKSLVTAHGGQIWASSKEGQGSTFGFSLQPYAQLSSDTKDTANAEITRNAHGWIKNHSLYKR